MYRGTTPTHVFIMPDEMENINIDVLYITYTQAGKTVLEKTLDDVTRDGCSLSVSLTQEETLLFDSTLEIRIQVRMRDADGHAFASQQVEARARKILKNGVI